MSQSQRKQKKVVSRQRMKTHKDLRNLCADITHEMQNQLHLKTRTHQLEAMVNIEAKWHKQAKFLKLETSIEEYLEKMDKDFFEQGYMSFSLFTNIPHDLRNRYMQFYLAHGFAKSLYNSHEFIILGDEIKIALLTFKVYAIRYPTKILTVEWIKPYLLSRVEKQGLIDRIMECCLSSRESISEVLGYAVDTIKRLWGVVVSAVTKVISGTMIKMTAAIIVAGIVLAVMSKWAAVVLFPYIFNEKKITMEGLGEDDGLVEKQAGGSEILEVIGRTITSVVEPAHKMDVAGFITEFGKYSGSLNSIERLVTNVWKYLKNMLDFLYASGNGGIPFSDEGKLLHEFQTKINMLESIKTVKDRATAIFITDLKEDAERIASIEVRRLYPAMQMMYLNYMLKFKKLFQETETVLHMAIKRVEPIWIHLVGDPGIGKTWVTNVLVTALYQAMYGKFREAEELIYVSKDPKFYPLYKNQFVLMVDDFLQKADPTERMIEAEKMIHFSNSAYEPLPSAVAEEKGLLSFNSEVIITTSNYKTKPLNYYPVNLQLTDNTALYRRFTAPLFVTRQEVESDDPMDNLMGYRFSPITGPATLGGEYSIDEVVANLVGKMNDKRREAGKREVLSGKSTTSKLLQKAAATSQARYEKLFDETKSFCDTTGEVHSMDDAVSALLGNSVEKQMDGNDDDDVAGYSNPFVKPPEKKKSGWKAATEAVSKIMSVSAEEKKQIIDIIDDTDDLTWAETDIDGTPKQRVLAQLYIRQETLILALSDETEGFDKLRICPMTKYHGWSKVNWAKEAAKMLVNTNKDIKIMEEKDHSKLTADEKKRRFLYGSVGSIKQLIGGYIALDEQQRAYVEKHADKEFAKEVFNDLMPSESSIKVKKAFFYDYKLAPESIREFHDFVTKWRKYPAEEALASTPVYATMVKEEPGKYVALVGETVVAIMLGKLQSRLELPVLDWSVRAFDIRIYIFANRAIGYTSEIYYAPYERPPKLIATNAFDAAVRRFTSSVNYTSVTLRKSMFKLTNVQETSWTEQVKAWWKGGGYMEESVTNFPRSPVPDKEVVDRRLVMFATEKTIAHDKRRQVYGEWFKWLGLIVLGSTLVAGFIILVSSSLKKIGQSPKVMQQSFDPKGDRLSRKTAKRIAKKAKIIDTKTTLMTQGVVKQSKATNVIPKVQRNIELIKFKGRLESYAYGTFVTPFEFVTVSHVFTQDLVKELEFCFSQAGTEGTITVGPSSFSVRLELDRELAIVKVDERTIPAHSSLAKHLPSNKEMPKIIQDILFVDHHESGHFLLRQAGDAKSDVAHFKVGGQANGVYSVSLTTEKGDCGLPYLSNSDYIPYCFRGIHIGWGDGRAYFTPVYQEDFPGLSSNEAIEIQSFLHPSDRELTIDHDRTTPIPGLKHIGNLKMQGSPKVFFGPSTNPYVHTDIKLDKPTEKVPVKLKKGIDPNGIMQNPFANAVASYSLPSRNYKPNGFNIQPIDFKGLGPINFKGYAPLEYKEVINGSTFLKDIRAMDITTSPGPGLGDIGLTTEEAFPGEPGSRVMGKEVAELVAKMEKHLEEESTPLPTFGVALLKMETKSAKKSYSPRIYINCAKANYVITKKYIGPIMEAMGRFKTDLGIGLDVFSAWRGLHRQAKEKSIKKIMADDVVKWDIHMRAHPFVQAFCEYLLLCQMEAKYVKRVRQIIEGALQCYIIFGDQLKQLLGMPSGWFGTAWLNSIYNSVTTRALFRIANPGLSFDEFVFLCVMGDDNLMAVSDELEDEKWNGKLFAELRSKYIGITTTSIFKDGREVPEFMPLMCEDGDEDGVAMFLKRRFRIEKGLVCPALELETIKAMITWVKPDRERSLRICTEENFATALRELCFHKKEVFEEHERAMRELCALKGYNMPIVDRAAFLVAYATD